MSPQRRFTLFTTPCRDPVVIEAERMAESLCDQIMPGLAGMSRRSRGEQGAVVIAQVIARSREKAILKIARLASTPRGSWIKTCFWASDMGISGVSFVQEKTRRKDGEWVSLGTLARLEKGLAPEVDDVE